MKSQPTPETDSFSGGMTQWIEHAQKLERQRDEARDLIKETERFTDRFCKERDVALKDASIYHARASELEKALKASAELLCFFFEKAGITRKDIEERLEAAK